MSARLFGGILRDERAGAYLQPAAIYPAGGAAPIEGQWRVGGGGGGDIRATCCRRLAGARRARAATKPTCLLAVVGLAGAAARPANLAARLTWPGRLSSVRASPGRCALCV